MIVNLSKDVLSQTHVNRKCTFCILGQYSAEQKCTVSIMSQVITLMPMVGKDVRNFASAVMNAEAGTVKERLFAWAVFEITSKTYKIIISLVLTGAPKENIVQNHLNIALSNVF